MNERQFQISTHLIAVGADQDYLASMGQLVMPSDTVLEIGCGDGRRSAELAKRCKTVIGIDTQLDLLRTARSSHLGVQFEDLSGFDIQGIQSLNFRFSKIYIYLSQIFGYESVLDALALLNTHALAFAPEVIVVKSPTLRDLALRSFAWDPARPPTDRDLRFPGPKFIGTRGVSEYRDAISAWVNKDDVVLEIGCEWGTTTALLAQNCRQVIGTDISSKAISKAREKHPHLTFEVLDGCDVVAAMKLGLPFTKVFIDISGLSSCHSLLDTLALLQSYGTHLKPEAIVIKSSAMKQFAQRFVAWRDSNSRDSSLSSYPASIPDRHPLRDLRDGL